MVMKSRPAVGTRGMLLRLGGDLGYVFRVYDLNGDFVDYDILHYDMEIQIWEQDAYFYEDGARACIDHSPETLGHK